MSRPGFEPGTHGLKVRCSAVELAALSPDYTRRLDAFYCKRQVRNGPTGAESRYASARLMVMHWLSALRALRSLAVGASTMARPATEMPMAQKGAPKRAPLRRICWIASARRSRSRSRSRSRRQMLAPRSD